jgi:hypothetical protein
MQPAPAPHGIGDADHRNFGDPRVRLHGFLDLARSQPVAGDVDHIVGASEYEVITVVVARCPIEGRIRQAIGKVEK